MKLSKTDIKRVIDSQSYQRGRTYADQGKIFSTKIDENKIIAKCVGSYESNYQLYCHVGDHEVGFGRCSCPVGSGGRCKHIAALLLTWIKDPEKFKPIMNLDKELDNLTVDQLRTIVSHMVNLNPNNHELVQTYIESLQDKTINTLGIRERIEEIIPKSMYYEVEDIEDRINSITISAELMVNSKKYEQAAFILRLCLIT